MTTAVEKLTTLVDSPNRYDIPLDELLPTQMEAARERMTAHSQSIQFVKNRIEDTGVTKLNEPADLVPLLFAHTAYKSYPESWLEKGRWPMMTQWLDTVCSHRVEGVDNIGVTGIDEWINRLAAKGHYITCSSGTTGKISMVPSSMKDRELVKKMLVASYQWATGLPAKNEHKMFITNPPTNNYRFLDSWDALMAAFCTKGDEFRLPGEPITVGKVRAMVTLRKSINEGTARPSDIATFENLTKEREQAMEDAVQSTAKALVESRGRNLLISGMFPTMYKVSEIVRDMGYGAKDFNSENLMMVSGGLKGANLPPDFRERIMNTFNVQPTGAMSMYGMQELNTLMPRCSAGRYHVAPWVMVLLLDQPGEKLVGPMKGEVEGRAAFFELSHDQRWGGLISGDKINVRYGKCACGHEGPTVGENIMRYSDLPGGDKITCAGTIDAYVRGAA
jgi:hypothetical protein